MLENIKFSRKKHQIIALAVLFVVAVFLINYFISRSYEVGSEFEYEYVTLYDDINPVLYADIITDKGSFTIRFLRTKAPSTVNDFINMVRLGSYNDLSFDHAIKDFMVQGGIKSKNVSYVFSGDINDKELVRGVVVAANNSSQFFILTAQNAPYIEGDYTVFGEVVEGIEIVDKITGEEVDEGGALLSPINIKNVALKKDF